MSLYLVTGGAGFVGSYLVRFLLDKGESVRVLDNFSTGKRENLEEVTSEIELVEGDLNDRQAVLQAVGGVDFVFHEAAIPSVPRSVEKPMESHQANASATLVLLQEAREAGVRRLVYASSSSVYGTNPELPKLETMCTEPLSPYAVAKLAAEHYCLVFHNLYGLETVALRYFNVFGPSTGPELTLLGRGEPLYRRHRVEHAACDPRRRRADARLHLCRQRRAGQFRRVPRSGRRRRRL